MTTIESMVIEYDPDAQELVIRTAQGAIVISRCQQPNITRVVLLPNEGGYLSVSDNAPQLVCMWAGVDVLEEPAIEDDDTQQVIPMFDESEG